MSSYSSEVEAASKIRNIRRQGTGGHGASAVIIKPRPAQEDDEHAAVFGNVHQGPGTALDGGPTFAPSVRIGPYGSTTFGITPKSNYPAMVALFCEDGAPPVATTEQITIPFELFEAVQERSARVHQALEKAQQEIKVRVDESARLRMSLASSGEEILTLKQKLESLSGLLTESRRQQEVLIEQCNAAELRAAGAFEQSLERQSRIETLQRDLQQQTFRSSDTLVQLAQKESVISALKRERNDLEKQLTLMSAEDGEEDWEDEPGGASGGGAGGEVGGGGGGASLMGRRQSESLNNASRRSEGNSNNGRRLKAILQGMVDGHEDVLKRARLGELEAANKLLEQDIQELLSGHDNIHRSAEASSEAYNQHVMALEDSFAQARAVVGWGVGARPYRPDHQPSHAAPTRADPTSFDHLVDTVLAANTAFSTHPLIASRSTWYPQSTYSVQGAEALGQAAADLAQMLSSMALSARSAADLDSFLASVDAVDADWFPFIAAQIGAGLASIRDGVGAQIQQASSQALSSPGSGSGVLVPPPLQTASTSPSGTPATSRILVPSTGSSGVARVTLLDPRGGPANGGSMRRTASSHSVASAAGVQMVRSRSGLGPSASRRASTDATADGIVENCFPNTSPLSRHLEELARPLRAGSSRNPSSRTQPAAAIVPGAGSKSAASISSTVQLMSIISQRLLVYGAHLSTALEEALGQLRVAREELAEGAPLLAGTIDRDGVDEVLPPPKAVESEGAHSPRETPSISPFTDSLSTLKAHSFRSMREFGLGGGSALSLGGAGGGGLDLDGGSLGRTVKRLHPLVQEAMRVARTDITSANSLLPAADGLQSAADIPFHSSVNSTTSPFAAPNNSGGRGKDINSPRNKGKDNKEKEPTPAQRIHALLQRYYEEMVGLRVHIAGGGGGGTTGAGPEQAPNRSPLAPAADDADSLAKTRQYEISIPDYLQHVATTDWQAEAEAITAAAAAANALADGGAPVGGLIENGSGALELVGRSSFRNAPSSSRGSVAGQSPADRAGLGMSIRGTSLKTKAIRGSNRLYYQHTVAGDDEDDGSDDDDVLALGETSMRSRAALALAKQTKRVPINLSTLYLGDQVSLRTPSTSRSPRTDIDLAMTLPPRLMQQQRQRSLEGTTPPARSPHTGALREVDGDLRRQVEREASRGPSQPGTTTGASQQRQRLSATDQWSYATMDDILVTQATAAAIGPNGDGDNTGPEAALSATAPLPTTPGHAALASVIKTTALTFDHNGDADGAVPQRTGGGGQVPRFGRRAGSRIWNSSAAIAGAPHGGGTLRSGRPRAGHVSASSNGPVTTHTQGHVQERVLGLVGDRDVTNETLVASPLVINTLPSQPRGRVMHVADRVLGPPPKRVEPNKEPRDPFVDTTPRTRRVVADPRDASASPTNAAARRAQSPLIQHALAAISEAQGHVPASQEQFIVVGVANNVPKTPPAPLRRLELTEAPTPAFASTSTSSIPAVGTAKLGFTPTTLTRAAAPSHRGPGRRRPSSPLLPAATVRGAKVGDGDDSSLSEQQQLANVRSSFEAALARVAGQQQRPTRDGLPSGATSTAVAAHAILPVDGDDGSGSTVGLLLSSDSGVAGAPTAGVVSGASTATAAGIAASDASTSMSLPASRPLTASPAANADPSAPPVGGPIAADGVVRVPAPAGRRSVSRGRLSLDSMAPTSATVEADEAEDTEEAVASREGVTDIRDPPTTLTSSPTAALPSANTTNPTATTTAATTPSTSSRRPQQPTHNKGPALTSKTTGARSGSNERHPPQPQPQPQAQQPQPQQRYPAQYRTDDAPSSPCGQMSAPPSHHHSSLGAGAQGLGIVGGGVVAGRSQQQQQTQPLGLTGAAVRRGSGRPAAPHVPAAGHSSAATAGRRPVPPRPSPPSSRGVETAVGMLVGVGMGAGGSAPAGTAGGGGDAAGNAAGGEAADISYSDTCAAATSDHAHRGDDGSAESAVKRDMGTEEEAEAEAESEHKVEKESDTNENESPAPLQVFGRRSTVAAPPQ